MYFDAGMMLLMFKRMTMKVTTFLHLKFKVMVLKNARIQTIFVSFEKFQSLVHTDIVILAKDQLNRLIMLSIFTSVFVFNTLQLQLLHSYSEIFPLVKTLSVMTLDLRVYYSLLMTNIAVNRNYIIKLIHISQILSLTIFFKNSHISFLKNSYTSFLKSFIKP